MAAAGVAAILRRPRRRASGALGWSDDIWVPIYRLVAAGVMAAAAADVVVS
jgi:hypothetical protein